MSNWPDGTVQTQSGCTIPAGAPLCGDCGNGFRFPPGQARTQQAGLTDFCGAAAPQHRRGAPVSRVWGRHSPTRPRLRSNERPSGAFEWQHGLRSKWRSLTPTSARPCDRTFSSIENLWPQVDTCFRPFRATLKISEFEPQCTLKILQSKTCEKAKPLLMVTVHTERSSCPCFAAALSGSPTESVRSWRSISFRRLM